MRMCVCDTSTPRRNNKWKRCDKTQTKKKDQQIRSIILKNSVVPPAHAQRVFYFLFFLGLKLNGRLSPYPHF